MEPVSGRNITKTATTQYFLKIIFLMTDINRRVLLLIALEFGRLHGIQADFIWLRFEGGKTHVRGEREIEIERGS